MNPFGDRPSSDFAHPSIERVRKLAWLMDEAIELPFVRKRIGLDPLLSAIPGGGDAAMLLLSLYTLWVAYELNLPRKVMLRMVVNLLVDYVMGLVPLVGDVGDFFWKANTANLKLLEEAYQAASRRSYQPAIIDVEANTETAPEEPA